MTTKRSLERRLSAIEERPTDEGERPEWLTGPLLWVETEPAITEYLASRGFVVEREERRHETGHSDILLHPTPAAADILLGVLWHYPSPTAPRDDVRVIWEDDRHEAVLADATQPVAQTRPDPPADSTVVAAGEGWRAVVPAGRAIETLVLRRSTAEHSPYDVLAPVTVPLDDADDYDLVSVDAEPSADRHPSRP